MGLFIERGSLDHIRADAIVNGTNTDKRWVFQRGRITSMRNNGACYKRAWSSDCGWKAEEQRTRFCKDGQAAELMQKSSLLRESDAKIFLAENYASFRYQIITAVPDWHRGRKNEKTLLRQCYENCLRIAMEKGCRSILFPQLGTGEHAFPPKVSIDIAMSTLRDLAREHDIDIHFMPSDDLCFMANMRIELGSTMSDLARYFNTHYMVPAYRSCKRVTRKSQRTDDKNESMYPNAEHTTRNRLPEENRKLFAADYTADYSYDVEPLVDKVKDLIPQKKPGELFREYLFSLMERTGKKKAAVYKDANLDRRIFSKIQKGTVHVPSKRTVLALAISMCLSLEEAKALLAQAGFAFSPSEKTDIIVEYFLTIKKYNIQTINSVLYSLGEITLGSMSWEDHKRKY